MSESVPLVRRRWQVRVWALLLVPVVCAPALYYFAMRDRMMPASDRMTPAERVERQWQWFKQPQKYPFSPVDGEPVVPADLLVILAEITFNGSYYTRSIRRLTPDGMIDQTINVYIDEWGSRGRIRGENLARLPALLRALPPSDPAASPTNRVIVAYPFEGQWVVLSYRNNAVPKPVEDLEKALEVPPH